MSMPPSYPPAPGQQPMPPGNGGVGAIGKHRNPFLVWLVWPLITLGIYHLVWWYKINREVRDFDQRIEVSPGLAVLPSFPEPSSWFRRTSQYGTPVIASDGHRALRGYPIGATRGSA